MLTDPHEENTVTKLGSPIERVLDWSAGLRVKTALMWVVVAWATVFAMDAASGRLISLNGLYLAPLCLTTWCLGRLPAFGIGAVAVVLTLWINGFGDGLSAQASTIPSPIASWNAGMRVFSVAFIILLVSAFRRTFDRERKNARVDPLTGLRNRRAFMIDSRNLQLAGTRDSRIMLSGIFDLDNFKTINDQQGHTAGDDTLRTAAKALEAALRPYDVTARIGGDEFAFCLLVRDHDAARRKVIEIHRSITEALGQLSWAASCSLGASASSTLETKFREADEALYSAKRDGKGLYVFA